MNNNKGFTLIELLIVIAIIGILAGVVLVSFTDSTAQADDAQLRANLRTVAGLPVQLLAEGGETTTKISTFCNVGLATTGSKAQKLVATQLNNIMTDVFSSIDGGSTTTNATLSNTDAVSHLHAAIVTGKKVPPQAGCASSKQGWVVWSQLQKAATPTTSKVIWCVDSIGFSGEITADMRTTGGADNLLTTADKIAPTEVNCNELFT